MYSACEIQSYLSEHVDELMQSRHHLHRHPEIGTVWWYKYHPV